MTTRMTTAARNEMDVLEALLVMAHVNLNRADRTGKRHLKQHEVNRNERLPWEQWRVMPGRRSCIDGRLL